MASEDKRLWEHSSQLRRICPSMFNLTQHAFARLQQIKTILANKGVHFTVPCGTHNGQNCDFLKQLSGWNDVLAAIGVEIKLVSGTEMAVELPERSPDHRETRARIQRAMVLLHWLLVKHTCVVSIEVGYLGEFNDPEWFALFCYGIRDCRRLKTLKIYADFDEAHYYRQLLTACSFLRRLEKLLLGEIRDTDNIRNMAILGDVVSRNTKLRKLEVDDVAAASKDTSAFMRTLQRCHSLCHLSLGVSSLNAEAANLFLKMLSGNNTLKSLCLDAEYRHRYITMMSISSALKNARALVKLELIRFRMQTHDAWMLANALVHAQTVQMLDLFYSPPCFSLPTMHVYTQANGPRGQMSRHIEPYIYILKKLYCLRSFKLDLLRFPSEGQRAFLGALAANEFLEDVYVRPPHCGLSELFCIADETGTASRVHSSCVVTEDANFASLPRGSSVKSVILKVEANPLNNEKPALNTCFKDLRTLDNVTNLHLEITGSSIHVSSAKLLAAYLQNTKRLKAVTLNLHAEKESSMFLLDAISRNTGIRNLDVENWCLGKQSAVVLADIVHSSKMMCRMTYNRKGVSAARAFFSRLSASIGSNFTLVSVQTFECPKNTKNWSVIQNATRRNYVFLDRAARFVAGLSFDKTDAEALELVASSPLLPARVRKVQKPAVVGYCEAATMIRQVIWVLKDLNVFMRVTGVVKESVVCDASGDCRPRLDTLPLDCWLAIRRYLSVADVVDNRSNQC